DVVEVGGVAAHDGAERDDGAVGAAGGQVVGGHRDLDRARHPGDVYRLGRHAVAREGAHGAGQQPLGDQGVEAAHDHGEAVAGTRDLTDELGHRLRQDDVEDDVVHGAHDGE